MDRRPVTGQRTPRVGIKFGIPWELRLLDSEIGDFAVRVAIATNKSYIIEETKRLQAVWIIFSYPLEKGNILVPNGRRFDLKSSAKDTRKHFCRESKLRQMYRTPLLLRTYHPEPSNL